MTLPTPHTQAIAARGAADADVLEKKAQAWKEYGDAALVQMIVDKLPDVAEKMAKPLEKTKEMVFVSSDGSGPSQLTGDISKMMAQIPATVHGLTGVDIRDVIKRKAGTIGTTSGHADAGEWSRGVAYSASSHADVAGGWRARMVPAAACEGGPEGSIHDANALSFGGAAGITHGMRGAGSPGVAVSGEVGVLRELEGGMRGFSPRVAADIER